MIGGLLWSFGGMKMTGKWSAQRKTCPSATDKQEVLPTIQEGDQFRLTVLGSAISDKIH